MEPNHTFIWLEHSAFFLSFFILYYHYDYCMKIQNYFNHCYFKLRMFVEYLQLVLLGLMLVQCIMSMPYEATGEVEQSEGQLLTLNNNEDMDLAQHYYRHHRGYGGYGRGGGFIIYGGGYRGYGGYGGYRRHHHRHYWG